MKLVSWNVNGIRACMEKNFNQVLTTMQADYFCVQETKASPDLFDLFTQPAQGYAQTWAVAEKKGYSGCAVFTPHEKTKLSSELGMPLYDREGRTNIAVEKDFTLFNFYFPNGGSGPERQAFKMKFLDEILNYFKKYEKKHGPLVICGDINIAHKEIDIHDPIANKNTSGFLPEERAWMDAFVEAGFIDTFRFLNPTKRDAYSWWSYRMQSRERNKGWRLDYFFVSEALKPAIKNAQIHHTIFGSDHCPVSLELDL